MSVDNESRLALGAYILLFVAAFWLGPLQFSEYFTEIPGDLGDARLNAYFLENIYQYIFGNSESLWHFGFYYPFPYVLGFSDNLFGLSPVFLLFRLIGFDAYESYLYWFMAGYPLNFFACLYALRRMGLSPWAAGLGALVFTFGLPVTAHSGHAQLHHRFAIPLAISCFVDFAKTKQVRSLLASYFWIAWQLAIGVYMGFFGALLCMAMTVCYLAIPYARGREPLKQSWDQLAQSYRDISAGTKRKYLAYAIAITAGLVLLFYPYLVVKDLYGFTRSWSDMRGMLPRLYSYIYAPFSNLWGFKWEYFDRLPVWWEHQMFPGMVPFVLSIFALVRGFKQKSGLTFRLFACSFIFLFCLTLSTGGGWWEYVHFLPLFSAIRAVSRIDMLYLLIYGFLAGYFIDLAFKNKKVGVALCLVLSAFFVYESSEMKTFWNKISRWKLKENQLAAFLPAEIPPNSVLFFAQKGDLAYEHEISAMWVAMKKGHKTMNGYSGNGPRGYNNHFKSDCKEIENRVQIYQKFAAKNNLPQLTEAERKRIFPVGFSEC